MSIETNLVQRVRVWSESSFGFDGTGNLGNYIDVPLREGSATIAVETESYDPQQIVQHIDEYRKEVLGKRKATLNFTMNIAPGIAGTTSVAANAGALGLILKEVMGGELAKSGSTAAVGSTAGVINVQTGHGPRFAGTTPTDGGGAIGWVNTSGSLELREIEAIVGDALTLKHNFSGAPSSTNPIYNCATYFMTANPTGSLQFIVEGLETDDRWLLLGGQCVGGFQTAFDVTGQSLPSITFNFSFASYKLPTETVGAISGSALGTATYSNYTPIVGHAGEMRVFDVGSAALTDASLVHCSAVSFAPTISFVPYTSPSGLNTIKQWVKARNVPAISGDWTNIFEDINWFTARDFRTDKAVFYQFGNSPSTTAGASAGAGLIAVPTVQIINPQRAADAGNLAAQKVQFKGRRDTDVGSATSDLAKSPFRIHLC